MQALELLEKLQVKRTIPGLRLAKAIRTTRISDLAKRTQELGTACLVSVLKFEPELFRSPKELGQTHGRIRSDCTSPAHNVVDGWSLLQLTGTQWVAGGETRSLALSRLISEMEKEL